MSFESHLKNWKTAYKSESIGAKSFGIEIRVAMDREFTKNDNMAMYRIAEQIEDAIMREGLSLDAEAIKSRQEEHDKLLDCFNGEGIFVEEIPNGYSNSWYYSQSPWYKVTTRKGIITLGWRKRVISIEWEPRVNPATADELFPNEDVTKYERLIHAWGYEKAKAYISQLLAS
jgi:hypothetical protein